MKNLAIVLILILASGSVVLTGVAKPLPDVVVNGTVRDASTGAPLPGVQIAPLEASLRSIRGVTDASGRYAITLPDPAWAGRTITLRFEFVGYAQTERSVTLGSEGGSLDLSLTPTSATPGEEEPKPGREGVYPDARLESEAAGFSTTTLQLGITPPSAVDRTRRHTPRFNTEAYAHIEESSFLSVESNPLSTFSIDVDRASYSNVRRMLRDGRRPPIDAVRIEELINYFTYADPDPTGDVPFAVRTEVATAPWEPRHHLVRIGLTGRSIELEDIPAGNLVFLIDVSGSMQSDDKLPLLKSAFRMLVDQLRPQDRVAIVVYAGAAGLVLEPTPGDDKDTILEAIESLEAGGSTAGGAGLALAYDIARRNHRTGGNNRVILATDGDFNVGASSDSEMVRLIEERREQGTFLTVLGFGTGNLKDAKMEQLADHGNGSFAYIDSRMEARKVLVRELGGTLLTIAKDVKLQVEFNPALVAAYRLIGYENRTMAAEDFADDRKDAGELGAGHTVTALYEVVPVGTEGTVAVHEPAGLRYHTGPPQPTEGSDELLFVKLRYKEPARSESRLVEHPVIASGAGQPSTDFRFAAAVAAWGMLLRDSEHIRDFTLADVADLAGGALGEDIEGYRGEFLRLVDRAQALDLLARAPGT